MEIMEAVMTRKSTRAFRPTPVPEEFLKEILQAAIRSPSSINTQPWECWVVQGETTRRLAEELYREAQNGGLPRPYFHLTHHWKEVYRNRMKENGKLLFGSLGINAGDREARKAFNLSMYTFYGAPQVLFVCLDESLGPYSIFDCGCLAQTICLLATSRGLGTCILESAIRYPDIIRKYVPIPPDKWPLVGIAIGYPDHESAITRIESNREPLAKIVQWSSP